MTAIRITNFGGIIPKLAERLLPDNAAQLAINTKLASGELRPMRKSKKVFEANFPVDVKSIFKVDDTTWFVWPTADVKMVRVMIGSHERYCYTGDGVPKFTTKALGTPVTAKGSPREARALGVPAPITAPIVTHSGGVGSDVSRYYCYTFVSDFFEESAPSPVSALVSGKVDGTWTITGMDVAPPNTGLITGATHNNGLVTVTTSAPHYLRVGDTVVISSVIDMTDLNGVWVVVAVPANNQFSVNLTTSQTYTSGGVWERSVPWGPCTKRLYRTAGTSSKWQLVAEGIVETSYNDTLSDALILGDELISTSWTPPPVGLKGLVALPNGALAGFDGSVIYQSEPFQPHAWPAEYQRKVDYPIVGIAPLADGSVVIATTGMPFLMTGYDPSVSVVERIETPLPCLSANSVCSIGDSAVYATRGGLARVGPGGHTLLTAELFSDEDWYALSPETMRCVYTRGNVYLVSDADPPQVFIIGVNLGSAGPVVTSKLIADCIHVDQVSGRLYYGFSKKVFEFDPDDGAPLMQNWFSKVFVVGQPINLGAAKIVFSKEYSAQAQAAMDAEVLTIRTENAAKIVAGRANGGINERCINYLEINGSELERIPDSETPSIAFVLYADGQQKFYRLVTDDKPFRLPSGYKADTFAVRVMSNTHVRSIELAETVIGLKQV